MTEFKEEIEDYYIKRRDLDSLIESIEEKAKQREDDAADLIK